MKTAFLRYILLPLIAAASFLGVSASAYAADKKPNILVIWGDDIGWQNVSAYGMGTMGYTTPHIDSVGMGGIRFTDHYAQPSCTAGRASFITGQPGQVLNGIQAHMDMFTSLAAAAGVADVAAEVMKGKKQYIDGLNSLPYWKGESQQSARNSLFYYFESKLTAVRMGPWKFHFSTKEDYYSNLVPRTVPLVFNIRMDPYRDRSRVERTCSSTQA